MSKDLPSVTCAIPLPGQQAHTETLNIGNAGKVLVTLPALGFRPGKACHVVLQWDRGGSFYGIPGASWTLGSQPVKQVVDLSTAPASAGVRLSLYTEVEAFSATPDGEARLFRRMTQLDAVIARGLAFTDSLAGEKFTLRGVERVANVGDVATEKELTGGGFKNVRRLTIVYALANGAISPVLQPGETLFARGIKLKVERFTADATALTIECVDFTG